FHYMISVHLVSVLLLFCLAIELMVSANHSDVANTVQRRNPMTQEEISSREHFLSSTATKSRSATVLPMNRIRVALKVDELYPDGIPYKDHENILKRMRMSGTPRDKAIFAMAVTSKDDYQRLRILISKCESLNWKDLGKLTNGFQVNTSECSKLIQLWVSKDDKMETLIEYVESICEPLQFLLHQSKRSEWYDLIVKEYGDTQEVSRAFKSIIKMPSRITTCLKHINDYIIERNGMRSPASEARITPESNERNEESVNALGTGSVGPSVPTIPSNGLANGPSFSTTTEVRPRTNPTADNDEIPWNIVIACGTSTFSEAIISTIREEFNKSTVIALSSTISSNDHKWDTVDKHGLFTKFNSMDFQAAGIVVSSEELVTNMHHVLSEIHSECSTAATLMDLCQANGVPLFVFYDNMTAHADPHHAILHTSKKSLIQNAVEMHKRRGGFASIVRSTDFVKAITPSGTTDKDINTLCAKIKVKYNSMKQQ
ncbi:hypothetical protein PFISCL1PPCAC_1523, partial [Pristionchus fissidentatus]